MCCGFEKGLVAFDANREFVSELGAAINVAIRHDVGFWVVVVVLAYPLGRLLRLCTAGSTEMMWAACVIFSVCECRRPASLLRAAKQSVVWTMV